MELRRLRLTLETLGPLHIGSGFVLQKDWDYVVRTDGGNVPRQVRVLNLDRALDSLSDQEAAALANRRPGALLDPQRLAAATRYTANVVAARAGVDVGQIREFIRDPTAGAFVPGSSLKGALRTALLLFLLERVDARRSARELEESAFAFDLPSPGFANRDLNRALRVSDLFAENPRLDVLDVRTHRIRAAPARGRDDSTIPTWCEVIGQHIRLQGSLTIETGGGWWERLSRRQQDALLNPGEALRAWSRSVIEFERQAWGGRMEAATDTFYTGLTRLLDNGAVLAVLGWGTGWQAKTIGSRLSAAEAVDLARQRRLNRRGSGADVFPVTRKLAATNAGPLPMGWVRLELSPL